MQVPVRPAQAVCSLDLAEVMHGDGGSSGTWVTAMECQALPSIRNPNLMVCRAPSPRGLQLGTPVLGHEDAGHEQPDRRLRAPRGSRARRWALRASLPAARWMLRGHESLWGQALSSEGMQGSGSLKLKPTVALGTPQEGPAGHPTPSTHSPPPTLFPLPSRSHPTGP